MTDIPTAREVSRAALSAWLIHKRAAMTDTPDDRETAIAALANDFERAVLVRLEDDDDDRFGPNTLRLTTDQRMMVVAALRGYRAAHEDGSTRRDDVSDLPLHHREPVETSTEAKPIDRYRVEGGWLYVAYGFDNGVALCFVPDKA